MYTHVCAFREWNVSNSEVRYQTGRQTIPKCRKYLISQNKLQTSGIWALLTTKKTLFLLDSQKSVDSNHFYIFDVFLLLFCFIVMSVLYQGRGEWNWMPYGPKAHTHRTCMFPFACVFFCWQWMEYIANDNKGGEMQFNTNLFFRPEICFFPWTLGALCVSKNSWKHLSTISNGDSSHCATKFMMKI